MTMANGVFGPTIRDVFDSTQLAVNFDSNTFKEILVPDTFTPDFDAHDLYADVSGSELSGTGYSAGGITMSGETWTIASGAAKLDATDTSQGGLTVSTIRGSVVQCSTLSGGPLILARTFGSDYAVTAGTLTIQHHASNGLWLFDYTP